MAFALLQLFVEPDLLVGLGQLRLEGAAVMIG
jgi:hypothetical protein